MRSAGAVLAGAVLFGYFPPAAADSQRSLAGLDQHIEQVRADWKNLGLAVAVVRGKEVLYARGFGVRQSGETAKIDTDTLFQVGSTTKAFTTAGLGMLVEEGRLHWDDPVIDHLPTLQLQDPWLTRHLTIRDALTHRTGITSTILPFVTPMDADETLRQLRHAIPEGAFRDSYRYSNLMYAVAGKLIETAAGASWRDFMHRRLFMPLEMSRSGASPYEFWDTKYIAQTFLGTAPAGHWSIRDAHDSNVAMPHAWDEDGNIVVLPWQSYDNAAAAGSIVSSAADMANWLILHLNEGRFAGRQLLGKETLQALHRTQNLHGDDQFPFEGTDEGYAMGWHRAQYQGTVHLAHGGGITGFPAYVALLPDSQLGVVVLSNGPKELREKLALHKAITFWIFDRLLGRPERDWRGEFLARSRNAQRALEQEERDLSGRRLQNAPPSLPLDRYAGDYENTELHSGRIRVRADKGRLVLSFVGTGAFSAPLEHWHHDLFRLRPSAGVRDVLGPTFVAFDIDARGQVRQMSLFQTTVPRVHSTDASAPQSNASGR